MHFFVAVEMRCQALCLRSSLFFRVIYAGTRKIWPRVIVMKKNAVVVTMQRRKAPAGVREEAMMPAAAARRGSQIVPTKVAAMLRRLMPMCRRQLTA